ncbi:MAG: hypothetical protein JWP15_3463 [Alphaproteobacteria bacterium]|nr:hypothetical protein [Alphaproteobacteria bacterium]
MAGIDNRLLAAGALLAGLGVALGAFGAHALRDILSPAAMGWWQTGIQYQMWHAIALVALAALPAQRVRLPAAMLGIGALIFSASLCAMALTGARWLGAVTPIGGALMILGWGLLAVRALRARD